METAIIKKNNLDFHVNSTTNSNSHSHSPTFLFHDGGLDSPEFKVSDIEMITIQSLTYTSLKDLLPPSPPPAIMSPTHNSSWHEIPIRNPLVKHAALAYLQPMSTPTEAGDKGLFGKLKDKCLCGAAGGGFGCFGWLGDVVLIAVKVVFCGFWNDRGSENGEDDGDDDDDDDDDYDEDDEDDQKVD
ncbi:hypothetical protein FEM48_Zijuj09G0165200 [Ziziphus jujuba var. spinosa]|uniref:Uncharacterized protein n=1 Tax=Ziziphus jujuba var. spinosa TaxID=714518 RepID=A0A978UU26_ZIZJJ|nr:hypothetical protein FEM48_Zijuj09G0165200 [Ziziphus jujuba var. spinosa]